jgi:hypothetical protein
MVAGYDIESRVVAFLVGVGESGMAGAKDKGSSSIQIGFRIDLLAYKLLFSNHMAKNEASALRLVKQKGAGIGLNGIECYAQRFA